MNIWAVERNTEIECWHFDTMHSSRAKARDYIKAQRALCFMGKNSCNHFRIAKFWAVRIAG
jgi:hypothetical protein